VPEYRRKKQYSGIKKPRNTNVPRYWQIISTCQVTVVFASQISTLNDGVRGSQSFFKTAYLSHFSDFTSLKNLSKFYFCLELQIRIRNCEPYTEVSFETQSPLLYFSILQSLLKKYHCY
jgi:hypothetical protein